MTARQLMHLYPRAWRERYGDEFAEFVGDRRLSAQQVIDIVGGAVDAWLSPTVRAAVRGATAGGRRGGATVIQELKLKCATTTPRYTTREALMYAGLMIVATFVMVTAGVWARRQGYKDAGEFLTSMAFPVSMLLTMPLYMKGQSWRVQTFFIVVPMTILILIGYVAVKI
jgi:hypothetical protein